jgi:hypothetical protein
LEIGLIFFSVTNNLFLFEDENGEVVDPSVQDGTYAEKENLYELHNLSTESSGCGSTATSTVEEEEEMEVMSPISSHKGTILDLSLVGWHSLLFIF